MGGPETENGPCGKPIKGLTRGESKENMNTSAWEAEENGIHVEETVENETYTSGTKESETSTGGTKENENNAMNDKESECYGNLSAVEMESGESKSTGKLLKDVERAEEEAEEGRGGGDGMQKLMKVEGFRTEKERLLLAPPSLLPQVLGTLVMAMIQLDVGATFAFPGVTLPQLLHHHNNNIENDISRQISDNQTSSHQISTLGDPHFTKHEAALFASVIHVGAMLGSFVAGIPMVRFGQRVTLVFVLPLSLVVWVLLYLAPTVWLILAARFVQGVCISLMVSATTTYVAEFAHSSYRGRLMASLELFRQVGSLFTFLLGSSTLTWRQIALIHALCNTMIPFLALTIYLPSSPRWLAMRGRTHDAHKALVFFRGRSYDSSGELATILDQMQNSKHVQFIQQLKLLRNPSIFRYVVIMLVLFSLYHFNGSTAISAYIVIIMNDAKVNISSYLAAVVVAATKVIGNLFFTIIVDRIDRKPLYFTTSSVCAVFLALLGGYYYDQTHGTGHLQGQDWLPVTCLAAYSFFIMSPVPNLLRSELFPTSVRSAVVPLLYTFFFIGAFVAVQTYTEIGKGLGSYGILWLFAGCNVLLGLTVATTLPETRGKTLEQITEMQRRRRRKKRSREP